MADLPNCPRGRTEQLLAKAAGLENDAPITAWSREEAYLQEIIKAIEEGGGGGILYHWDAALEGTTTFCFYDRDLREPVPAAEVYEAFSKGRVILREENSGGVEYSLLTAASTDHDHSTYDFKAQDPWGTPAWAIHYNPTNDEYTYSPLGDINVVQTTGNSTTAVMSQKAATDMVYQDSNSRAKIRLGYNAAANGSSSVSIGSNSNAGAAGSVAIGAFSNSYTPGVMDIGSTNTQYGYNSTNYRLLSGVHDPVNAHDAATKGYIEAQLRGLTLSALTQAQYDALATKDANTLYIIKAA